MKQLLKDNIVMDPYQQGLLVYFIDRSIGK